MEVVHTSGFIVLQCGGAGGKLNAEIWGQSVNPWKLQMGIYQKRFELENSHFLWRRSLAGISLCSTFLTIGAKLSPQIGFDNPQDKSLEAYNSITVGAGTLKFGMQVATVGQYPKWTLRTNRITTDETGRNFPLFKVPMALESSFLLYCHTNFWRIILSFDYLFSEINYLLTDY